MNGEWVFWCLIAIGCVAFIYIAFRMTVRRHQKEIEKFKSGPVESNEAYLKKLGIEQYPKQADLAIWFRALIAEFGKIPAEAVMPEHRIWKDFDRLPFYDSPDTIDFIIKIEDRMDISIPDEQAVKIIPHDPNLTVKDMTLHLISELSIVDEKLKYM